MIKYMKIILKFLEHFLGVENRLYGYFVYLDTHQTDVNQIDFIHDRLLTLLLSGLFTY